MRANAGFSRIVIFASGKGTGFERLLEDRAAGRLPVEIAALACNVASAGAVEIAHAHNVPVALVEHQGLRREEHELKLLTAVKDACGVDLKTEGWVVLAGYMRLFSPQFMELLADSALGVVRAVNIHPSLLPAFPGVDAYDQAWNHGVKVVGCTVHLLSSAVDDGPIVAQAPLVLRDDETLESLRARGHALEHEVYGATIARLARGGWKLEKTVGGARQRVVFP